MSETHEFAFEGHRYTMTLGLFDDGAPGEIFIAGAKSGSGRDAELSDSAILASLALQHGTDPATLAKSMSRLPTDPWKPATEPASPIGAALDLLARRIADG